MGNFSRRNFIGMGLILSTAQMCKKGSIESNSQLPLNAKLVLLGDSITRMGVYEDRQTLQSPALSIFYTNTGYGNLANILSGSRFFVPLSGNQGMNGDTVAGVLSRLPDVIALNPAVVLLLIGINSIFHDISEESIKNDYRFICDKLIASGSVVVAVTILPHFAGLYPELTLLQETTRQNINSFIRSQTDIKPVDVESHMKDPAYFLDGLHPNSVGVYRLATKVATVLGSLIEPGKVQDSIESASNCVTNPVLKGTKGTLIDAVGTVADAWTLMANEAGGAIVTGSKSISDDRQIIQMSGNYTGDARKAQLRYASETSLNIHDLIEAFLDIEILESLENISIVNLTISGFNADYSQFVMYGESFHNSEHSLLQLPIGRYIMRTPPQTLTYPVVNLIAHVSILFMDVSSGSGISGKFKVHNCSVRKIV